MEQLTTIFEAVMAWVQANPEMTTNGVAGAVLGPIVAKFLKGGFTTGTLGGLIGGVAAGYGVDQSQYSALIGDEGLMAYVQNIAEGALGGGVLGLGTGAATRNRG